MCQKKDKRHKSGPVDTPSTIRDIIIARNPYTGKSLKEIRSERTPSHIRLECHEKVYRSLIELAGN